jgi:hypothetical protein
VANNSITTNLNTSPYYDDFDPAKNYVRILYKPSLAVQARELTQQQSALQKQIDYFGEHIFQEGALVRGGKINIDFNLKYVKVKDRDSSNNILNVTELAGKSLSCSNTGVKAIVIDVASGSEAAAPDTKVLFIKYTSSGISNNAIQTFTKNQRIAANNGVTFDVLNTTNESGNSAYFSITDGVVFGKDHFLSFPAQNIVIGKFKSNPTVKIGFNLVEAIVDSNDDPTLLDPANGSSNYAAPGADRLKITPTLVSYANSALITEDFVQLADIKDGVVQSLVTHTQYSQIRDELARRTYDESGSYYVKGLNVTMREHLNDGTNFGLYTSGESGNSSLLAVGVEPGKAYVYGYDVERLVTGYVPVDKGIDTKELEEQVVSANYGNYILVKEMVGSPNINDGITVNLYSGAGTRITGLGYSSTAPNGNFIGTAILKSLDYETGTIGLPNCQYRAYLTNVKMSNGTFNSVKSIYYNNASNADFGADLVDQNPALMNEKAFTSLVFEIPSKNIRRIRDVSNNIDTSFTFKKSYDVSIATPGTFTLNTGSANEIFPFGTGLLNSTQKSSNFILTFNTAATVAMTGTITGTSGANTFTGSGTTLSTKLNVGDKITVNGQTRRIASLTSATVGSINGTWASSFAANTFVKQYVVGDNVNMTNLGGTGVAKTINITSSTSAAFDLKETLSTTVSASVVTNLTKTAAKEIKKTIRKNRFVIIRANNNIATVNGPWILGHADVVRINSIRKKNGTTFTTSAEGSDVSDQFILDNGQKDDLYDFAKLRKKAGTTINGTDYLLVDLDYFFHDTSQGIGYYSVDSYPVDDVHGAANTNAITTAEIPKFTSPTTGHVYNLRDCIDIRDTKSSTANNSTTVTGATTNPVDTTTLVSATGGLRTMKPNETMTMDYSYYLPRKDIIVIDKDGKIKSVRGIPNIVPALPQEPSDSFSLAQLYIAPYPSLPNELANLRSRPEYENKIVPVAIRRYTMEMIGALEKRIERLEYYVALNFLEKETLDLKILDGNGLDRFKNGIIVDPFNDHSIGDTSNADYKIAVDREKSEIRPSFELEDVGIEYVSGSSVVKTGNLITMPYTHVVAISQPYAVTSRNAAGLFYNYEGHLTLTPDSDYWTNTTQVPALHITENNDLSNWQNLAKAWGTDWGDWSTNWTSKSTTQNTTSQTSGTATTKTTATTVTTTAGQTRTGTQLKVSSSTVTQNYGDRVIDVSVVPFMRSKTVQIFASGMKPNTRLYATFDGEPVSAYVTPTNSSYVATAARGGALVSDNNGIVYGLFLIPNNSSLKFRTGTKLFRLTDNAQGFTDAGLATTQAACQYTASGLNETKQATIVSTVVPKVTIANVVDKKTVTSSATSTDTQVTNTITNIVTVPGTTTTKTNPLDRRHGNSDHVDDPIAQTFKVVAPEGVPGYFVTKVDLYFATKHPVYGAIIEIRALNSSQYLTQDVLPYSRVRVASASINTSVNGTTATTVTFQAPVFLLADTSYALVVKPEANNDQTKVFVSKLGDADLITGLKITTQPYTGVLYISSNDGVYEPVQDEDLKFNLYRASFTTGFGTATLGSMPVDYLELSSVSDDWEEFGEEVRGNTRATLSSISGGVVANTDLVVGATSGTKGTVYTIAGSAVRLKNVDIGKDYTSGETVNIKYANNAAKGVTATISAISIPKGTLSYYNVPDSTHIYMDLDRTNSVAFSINEEIRGQRSNTSAIIERFRDKKANLINLQSSEINLAGTSVEWSVKQTANTVTLDSAFTSIQHNADYIMTEEKLIMSRTNEINNLSSAKSLQCQAQLYTPVEYISPVIDSSRNHTIYVHNIVNNDSTNENQKLGGNALARYISQKVTLAEGQDAEDLRCFITAYKPVDGSIKVYAKALSANDSDVFDDRPWTELTLYSKDVFSDSENTDDFKEYEYGFPVSTLTGSNGEYTYLNSLGVSYTGYKYFSIKIVLLSTNSVHIPRCRDMRAICLQI